jgi:hypothetical protein
LTDNQFEIGIHPNFLDGSSHGDSMTNVMDFCLDLAPNARAMRTHALYSSLHLFRLVADDYRQIETDVSMFMPFQRGLRPFDYCVGIDGNGLVRIPYYWQDDIVSEWPGWSWDSPLPESDGLRVFDFHPVFLALNIDGMAKYRALKDHLGTRRLFEATPDDFAPFINTGLGNRWFFETVIAAAGNHGFRKVSDITDAFRSGREI